MRWRLYAVCLALCLAGELAAQPYPPPYNPYVEPGVDPRVRYAAREQALTVVGSQGRGFVEALGDDAVAAIFACSKPAALKLVTFYQSGDMDRLPRPRDFLRVVSQLRPGDEVVLWSTAHVRELTDQENFESYLAHPLEISLGLKSLADAVAEQRARNAQVAMNLTAEAQAAANARQGLIVCVAILVVVALIFWWRRQRQLV